TLGSGAQLTQNTFTIQGIGQTVGPLTITVFSDGFVPFGGPVNDATILNSISTTLLTSGTASVVTTISPGNPSSTDAATLTGPLGGAAATTTMSASLGNPFSVTQTLTVSGLGPGVASLTATSTVVQSPVPPGLVLA